MFFRDRACGFLMVCDGSRGGLFLGNEKSDLTTNGVSQCFVGIEDTTLVGVAGLIRPTYHCQRLVVVQLLN